jgi:hypothetical protein
MSESPQEGAPHALAVAEAGLIHGVTALLDHQTGRFAYKTNALPPLNIRPR